jgi:hypothetical protein
LQTLLIIQQFKNTNHFNNKQTKFSTLKCTPFQLTQPAPPQLSLPQSHTLLLPQSLMLLPQSHVLPHLPMPLLAQLSLSKCKPLFAEAASSSTKQT